MFVLVYRTTTYGMRGHLIESLEGIALSKVKWPGSRELFKWIYTQFHIEWLLKFLGDKPLEANVRTDNGNDKGAYM